MSATKLPCGILFIAVLLSGCESVPTSTVTEHIRVEAMARPGYALQPGTVFGISAPPEGENTLERAELVEFLRRELIGRGLFELSPESYSAAPTPNGLIFIVPVFLDVAHDTFTYESSRSVTTHTSGATQVVRGLSTSPTGLTSPTMHTVTTPPTVSRSRVPTTTSLHSSHGGGLIYAFDPVEFNEKGAEALPLWKVRVKQVSLNNSVDPRVVYPKLIAKAVSVAGSNVISSSDQAESAGNEPPSEFDPDAYFMGVAVLPSEPAPSP